MQEEIDKPYLDLEIPGTYCLRLLIYFTSSYFLYLSNRIPFQKKNLLYFTRSFFSLVYEISIYRLSV